MTACGSNVYTNPNIEIISPSRNVRDLGIYMLGDCTFNYHISSLSKSVLICHRVDSENISDQTYNSTRKYTTVIHQTYCMDE